MKKILLLLMMIVSVAFTGLELKAQNLSPENIRIRENRKFQKVSVLDLISFLKRNHGIEFEIEDSIDKEIIDIEVVKGENLNIVLSKLSRYNIEYHVKNNKIILKKIHKYNYDKDSKRNIETSKGKSELYEKPQGIVVQKTFDAPKTNFAPAEQNYTRNQSRGNDNRTKEIVVFKSESYKNDEYRNYEDRNEKRREYYDNYDDFGTNRYYNYRRRTSNEEYDEYKDNRFYSTYRMPTSTFAIDVDTASYTNVRKFIENGQMPPEEAVRVEEFINYFKYDYQTPNDGHPFRVNAEVAECPWNSQNKLLRIGIKGEEYSNREVPASNIVFLVDVSGSMSDNDKLPLIKRSLIMMTEELRAKDRISIVTYSGRTEVIIEGVRGSEKNRIERAIDSIRAAGSTAGGRGIQTAYRIAQDNFIRNGNNRIILATDGDFNVGLSSKEDLGEFISEKRRSGVFLTVLGVGTGNLKDSQMQELANKGNGNYFYLDNIFEAKKVLVNEFTQTLLTIAKDVKIQVEFNPRKVKSYRLIGYENRVMDNRDFNNDRKDGGELGAGHTMTALYEIVPNRRNDNYDEDLRVYHNDEDYYQESYTDEIATLKLRYKKPKENRSNLMVFGIRDSNRNFASASTDFRFAAAVAEFAMLLKDSQYIQYGDYDEVIRIARRARGEDYDGYRAEFIRLVEKAALLDRNRGRRR